MLSQQDFSMIESMMERVVSTNNEKMKDYIDERFEQNNADMKEYIDERFEQNNAEMKEYVDNSIRSEIHRSESFLLDEIDRYYNFSKRDFQKLSSRVDDIARYYKIQKSEDRQYEYLFRMYFKQQKEIDEIKQVLAM